MAVALSHSLSMLSEEHSVVSFICLTYVHTSITNETYSLQ